MAIRRLGALSLSIVLLCGACARSAPVALGHPGQQVSGCAEALRERATAIDAVDAAEKQALQRNPLRAGQLQAAASEGKGAVMATADLTPCGDPSASSGVAIDLADLRARYRVVIERTTGRLTEIAAQPPPAPPPRANTKGKDKSKGD